MGILQKLALNATQTDTATVQAELAPLLIEGEHVEIAFRIIRDQIIFTNRRLITADKQGVTGKKVSYRSVPYDRITQFAKESAGVMDLDAELKLWIGSADIPLTFEFSKDAPINDVYALLSERVLGVGAVTAPSAPTVGAPPPPAQAAVPPSSTTQPPPPAPATPPPPAPTPPPPTAG
ncbi:MAG: PH domain-containing protein [Actinomycetota bacterium]